LIATFNKRIDSSESSAERSRRKRIMFIGLLDHFALCSTHVGTKLVRRHTCLISLGISEAVQRASVSMHLPIDIGLAHLLIEGGNLFPGYPRIRCAVTDQDPTFDVTSVIREFFSGNREFSGRNREINGRKDKRAPS
jgi:hypothetical protein